MSPAPMAPEEWQRIKSIFDRAADLAAADREPFLADACEGDARLMGEVRSLLASLEQAGDFIEASATLDGAADPAFRAGASIGPYRIVQVIGEGGMGMVYQAVRVDDLYRKLVALKVVRRGTWSRVALRKFETERHILAHLEHPNIARLLDGGTTADGQPYFVMDFIAGTPIDEHCDHERLPLRMRVELFLTVCSAVRYAHQNFIVHRDIKPQNILVTADGSIRLLDFGIAKLLDPEAENPEDTASMVQMMTPEYSSPEQLRNEPVTTASDTWSLGVLLYVLLTGHKPFVFRTRSPQEVYEVIRDTEPRRPSVVVRNTETSSGGRELTPAAVASARGVRPDRLAEALTGDLDNILLMALRREPQRRYVSVEQLMNDIRHYLDGLPVAARKDTLAYRAGKFVGRHRGAVVAASFAAAALIAGTITTSWQAHVATLERERAERRFNDVRRVANSLLFDVHDAIRDLPGSAPARRLIVVKALEFLDHLAQDSPGDRALGRELAAAYERVGDVQVQAGESGAAASYRKALSIRENLTAASEDDEIPRDLAPNYGKLSDLLWSAGDRAGAVEYSRKLLQVSQSLAARPGASRQDRIRLASSLLDYGYKQGPSGVADCSRALDAFARLAAESPADKRLLRAWAIARDRTAELLSGADALQLRRSSLALKESLLQSEPENIDYRRLVASGELDTGRSVNDIDMIAGALEAFKNLSDEQDVAMAEFALGAALYRNHDRRAARTHYARGFAIVEKLRAENRLQPGQSARIEEAQRAYEALGGFSEPRL